MKKILFFFFALLMVVPISNARPDGDDPVDILIIGEGGTNNGDPFHRSSGEIPIEASYYSSLSMFLLNFSYDLGSVSIEIENLTTGAYSQTVINATQGAHPLVIAGTAGVYEITFTLTNGVVYIGSFEIE